MGLDLPAIGIYRLGLAQINQKTETHEKRVGYKGVSLLQNINYNNSLWKDSHNLSLI